LPTRRTERIAGVDVLRGLSVLLVLLHHINLRFILNHYPVRGALPHGLSSVLFWSGYYAVIMFFTISGFLITRLSIQRWGSVNRIPIAAFYRLRVARIIPCLLLLLLVISTLHLLAAPEFQIPPERVSLGRALLAALTFHLNWLEGHHGYLPGCWDILWSLSNEETFYLLFPLISVLLRSERLLLLPLFCLIVIGPINRTLIGDDNDPWNEYAYLSCMDAIAFGCLAALANVRLHLSTRALRTALTAGLALTVLIVVTRDFSEALGLSRAGLDVTVLEAAVALMLLAFGGDIGNRAVSFGTGWLRTIGHTSYEVYLFHMVVVLWLIDLFKRNHAPDSLIPLVYAAMLLLSLALGYAIFRLYSEPLNRALRARR
jgi:peptidoglycan/LPS O-acetylase OafA/YrhL